MFWKKSKKIAEQAKIIKELESKVSKLEEDLVIQKRIVDTQQTALEGFRTKTFDQEFDIEGIDVYAIEYNYEEQQTVIGYKYANGVKSEFSEWLFKTTFEQHKKLVNRFRNKIRKKASKK